MAIFGDLPCSRICIRMQMPTNTSPKDFSNPAKIYDLKTIDQWLTNTPQDNPKSQYTSINAPRTQLTCPDYRVESWEALLQTDQIDGSLRRNF